MGIFVILSKKITDKQIRQKEMKMKKLLTLVVTVLLASVFTLAACASSSDGLATNPATTDLVTSNGGVVVQKGDYIYFANGYDDVSTYNAGDNDWGDISYGAIFRTKLDENGNVTYDDDGFLTDIELVVPKLVGYEGSSFYIYGDYIYYSTFNNNKDRYGNSLTTLTDYFRVDIDGTNNEKLYTSQTENLTNENWTIYSLDSTQYLVVLDGEDLIRIKASGSIEQPVTIAEGVSSVAFYDNTRYENNTRAVVDGFNNYVYYTRAVQDSDNVASTISGNYLARVKVNSTTEEIVYSAGSYTYEVKELANNSIYYTKSESNSSLTDLWFRSEIGEFNQSVQLTYASYDEVIVLQSDTSYIDNYVLAYGDSNLYLLQGANTPALLLSEDITILSVVGDSVLYYDNTNSELHRIANIKNANNLQDDVLDLGDKSIYTESANLVDYDGANIYVFASYTSSSDVENYYLNRINLNSNDQTPRFVGKFETADIPSEPDNSDLPEDEWTQWII